MEEELVEAVDLTARLITESTYVVAMVGAGLSAESDIPTFRGPGGLWTRFGRPSLRGYKQFMEDPAAWWQRHLEREADPARDEFREALDRAEPNAGHYALADLESIGALKLTITQNIDDLHQRAGSRNVAEIHGNRNKLRCVECEARWPADEYPIDRYPPRCRECGGLVKFDTVMFGEPIPPKVLEWCHTETERCDCMIVAGTSATVYPAARFPQSVKARGGRLIEANPNHTPLTHRVDVALKGPTGKTLPMVARRVREIKGLRHPASGPGQGSR